MLWRERGIRITFVLLTFSDLIAFLRAIAHVTAEAIGAEGGSNVHYL